MKITLASLTLFLLLPALSFCQEEAAKTSTKKAPTNYELTLGVSGGEFYDALSATHFWGLGKSKKFKVGLGLRLTNYFGTKQEYLTAPARLTSNKTDPSALFTENIEANFDTLTLAKAQVNALNISINLQYTFFSKLDLGFNIDALGFSFGTSQSGTFQSSIAPPGTAKEQKAKPTSVNYLLVSDNDKGTLNSELYLRYWLNPNMGIKAGLGFLFTEYTTTNKLTFNNDRFRNKSAMPVLGYTYQF